MNFVSAEPMMFIFSTCVQSLCIGRNYSATCVPLRVVCYYRYYLMKYFNVQNMSTLFLLQRNSLYALRSYKSLYLSFSQRGDECFNCKINSGLETIKCFLAYAINLIDIS